MTNIAVYSSLMSYHVSQQTAPRSHPLNAIIKLSVGHEGLYDITHKVTEAVVNSGVVEGLVTLFIRHTSASLLVQENADPKVQDDLITFMHRLVPETPELYTHIEEGVDDMPAHIKSALTAVSLSIPIMQGAMVLGTWQGIYLWEHRHRPGPREIVVSVL